MSSSKAPVDSKSPYITTTASPLDIPPAYHVSAARCTSGLIDFAHLSTLTPEQLVRFDEELVVKCRVWLASQNTIPMVEFRDWLRGYGFFVSNSQSKYRERAVDPSRPLGERLMAMVAFAEWTVLGDSVVKRSAFWETVRELVEVRGLVDRV
ncbi:hypothetical protein DFP73DRAFT_239513 [Morchella snyderi]|nr:hypothetical protein DFP73DRAFT_239513 [Morchella snyderi]